MSDLSQFLHKAADWLSGVITSAQPSDQATVSGAVGALQTAGSAVERAIPVVAKAVVDGLEARYGASGFTPLTNAIFDAVIAELQKRMTPA
jgi:hypothetical protein